MCVPIITSGLVGVWCQVANPRANPGFFFFFFLLCLCCEDRAARGRACYEL